jgi:transcriptional regulator with XRE-family HTH domain
MGKSRKIEMTEDYINELKDIGKAVRHARKKAGMSMRDVTAVSGVQAFQLCNIENAKTGTKTSTLHRLFKSMGTTMREAFKALELYEG